MSQEAVVELRMEERRLCTNAFEGIKPAEALARARAQAPLHLEEALAWSRELAQQARGFLEESELFPLPSDEMVVVERTPEAFAPLIPLAAFFPAPKFAPLQRGTYVVTDNEMDGLLHELSVPDLETLVVHEAYPGRHLQVVWANTATTVPRGGVPLGFCGGVGHAWAAESSAGWAHHCEELTREIGFRDSPSGRLLMIRHAMLRAVRVLVDVGLATGRLTFEQSVTMLLEHARVSQESATAEARRTLRRPTYPLSYFVGKRMIEGLRRQANVRWRPHYTDRAFHEFLLYSGELPLAFLQDEMDHLDEEQNFDEDTGDVAVSGKAPGPPVG
jgi:uncharacterized protein (DUF885 family)